jgi:hypothetical protein
MTKKEIKLQKKATALNAIIKLYNPLYKHKYTYYEGEGSFGEQRDSDVKQIITQLEKELEQLKN